jgi:hypothetical protein
MVAPARAAPDAFTRLAELAHDLRVVSPLHGAFLIAAVGMTRSGEMAPRQLAAAVVATANRLEPEQRAFADQLRNTAAAMLAALTGPETTPELARLAQVLGGFQEDLLL